MVWLDICDNQGNAIYFDVHHVDRKRSGRRWQHSVNGICGNGLFEIEVLVEPGSPDEVTYVDLSSGAFSRNQLFSGLDSVSLDSELVNVARKHCGLDKSPVKQAEPYPHPRPLMRVSLNESGPFWQSTA